MFDLDVVVRNSHSTKLVRTSPYTNHLMVDFRSLIIEDTLQVLALTPSQDETKKRVE
jgi:hypothetical protein